MLIVFLAWLTFEAIDIAIDRKIEAESGYTTAAPGEEGSDAGTSRLTILLPLFRNFLLIVIVVIAGMIALAELGGDFALLFAGAGVLGLAIGFGAQSLIRDIFSGVFFLIDYAFRIAEYIHVAASRARSKRYRSAQCSCAITVAPCTPFRLARSSTSPITRATG